MSAEEVKQIIKTTAAEIAAAMEKSFAALKKITAFNENKERKLTANADILQKTEADLHQAAAKQQETYNKTGGKPTIAAGEQPTTAVDKMSEEGFEPPSTPGSTSS